MRGRYERSGGKAGKICWLMAEHQGEESRLGRLNRLSYPRAGQLEALKSSSDKTFQNPHQSWVSTPAHGVIGSRVRGCFLQLKTINKAWPSNQSSHTSIPILKMLPSSREDIHGNITFHRTSTSSFSAHQKPSQRRLQFYGCEKRENMRITTYLKSMWDHPKE